MACPPEVQGDARELQIGVSPGEACPAGTRVTWGLSHSITPLTAPWRLLWEGCSAQGLEVKLRPSPLATGVGSAALRCSASCQRRHLGRGSEYHAYYLHLEHAAECQDLFHEAPEHPNHATQVGICPLSMMPVIGLICVC